MAEKFNTVKKGYDPNEVETYINNLENIINSYKEKDAAIKNAILSSQVAGDNIVNEARKRADEIIAGSIRIVNEISNLVVGRRDIVSEFKDDYSKLFEKYLQSVRALDFEIIFAKIDSLQQYYNKIKDATEDTPEENRE